MSYEKYIIIVGAGAPGIASDALLDHPGLTAPLDIGPPRMDLVLRREPIIPEIHFPTLRGPKKRDWEQRQRKRRKP